MTGLKQAVRRSLVQAVVDLGRNIRPFRVQNRRNMYTYNLFKYSNCCSASDNNKDTYYFLINPDEDEKLSEMATMVSEGAFRPVFQLETDKKKRNFQIFVPLPVRHPKKSSSKICSLTRKSY